MEGGHVPDWAVAFLQMLATQREAVEQETLTLRQMVNMKIAEFRDSRAEREAQYQRDMQAEAVRINNEILKARDSVGTTSLDYEATKREKMADMHRMELQIREMNEAMRTMTEQITLLATDLSSLKKLDIELEQKIKLAEYNKSTMIVTKKEEQPDERPPPKAQKQYPPLPLPKFILETLAQGDIVPKAIVPELSIVVAPDRTSAMLELLMLQDLSVVATIAELTPVNDIDPIARGLIHLYEHYGRDYELLQWVVQWEVNNTPDPNQLFRLNSMASKMLTAYARQNGPSYLKDTLGGHLTRIVKENKAYEIDPDKLTVGQILEDNSRALKSYAQEILVEICNSAPKMPMQFRKSCLLLRREVTRKFPGEVHNALGGFLFQRFFCPALLDPEKYVTDLQLGEIGINARRTLVLLSKALQSVSNATQFKESYMVPLTSLVTNNVAFVKKFFTEISKFTDTGVWADPIEHPPDEAIADVLKGFENITSQQLTKYQQKLDEITMRLPQNNNVLPRFGRNLSYFHRERMDVILNNLVASQISQTIEAPVYAHDFIEHLVADDKTVIDSITAVSFSKNDIASLSKLGQSLASVAVFADLNGSRGEDLIRSVLRKEMATATPGSVESKRKLMNSFGSFLVKFFFRYYLHDYLVAVLKPHVDQIRKGKVFGKLNKKGLQFCNSLLASMKSSLSTAGAPVWKACNFLARQIIDMTAPYWLLKVIVPALENVEFYCGEQKEREKMTKKIGYLITLFTKMASGEDFMKPEDKNYGEINPWMKVNFQLFSKDLESWAAADSSQMISMKANCAWEEARMGLHGLIEFLTSEWAAFEMILSKKVEARKWFSLGQLFFATAQQPKPRPKV